MSGQDWSVLITPPESGDSPSVFTPNLQGQAPGAPLQTGNSDMVSWNNRTPYEHQPWPLDPSTRQPLSESDARKNGLYLSDVIPPWTPSTPGYVTAASPGVVITIYYTCTKHPDEHGTIQVWPQ